MIVCCCLIFIWENGGGEMMEKINKLVMDDVKHLSVQIAEPLNYGVYV